MLLQNFLIPNVVAQPAFMVKCDEPSTFGSFYFMKQELEFWKDMPYTNSEYQLSSFGNFRSWLRKGCNRVKLNEPHLLKTPLNGNGYPHTSIFFL